MVDKLSDTFISELSFSHAAPSQENPKNLLHKLLLEIMRILQIFIISAVKFLKTKQNELKNYNKINSFIF